MANDNTTVRYTFTAMLDSVMDLYDGNLTYTELLNMDSPMTRSLVKSRLGNLARKRKTRSKELDDMK